MSAHSDAELKIRRSLSPCWQSEWSSICQLTPVPCRAPCSGPYCDATEHLPSPMGKRGKGASLPDKDSGEKAPVAAGKAAPTRRASTAAVTQPKAANSAPTTKAAAATKASAAVDKPAAKGSAGGGSKKKVGSPKKKKQPSDNAEGGGGGGLNLSSRKKVHFATVSVVGADAEGGAAAGAASASGAAGVSGADGASGAGGGRSGGGGGGGGGASFKAAGGAATVPEVECIECGFPVASKGAHKCQACKKPIHGYCGVGNKANELKRTCAACIKASPQLSSAFRSPAPPGAKGVLAKKPCQNGGTCLRPTVRAMQKCQGEGWDYRQSAQGLVVACYD